MDQDCDNNKKEDNSNIKLLNKIGIGTVANFLSVGFNKFSSLVFYFLLFWILPVDKAGLVFIALGFISIITTFLSFGIHISIQRFTAYYQGRKEYGKIKDLFVKLFLIMLILSISVSFILFFFQETIVYWYNQSINLLSLMPLIILSSLFTIICKFLLSYIHGRQKFINYSILNTLPFLIKIIFLIVFICLNMLSAYWVLMSYCLGFLISGLLILIYCVYDIFLLYSFSGSLKFKDIMTITKFGLSMFLTQTSGALTSNIDTLSIGYYMDDSSVASYNAVIILAKNVGSFISLIFNNILKSVLSYYSGLNDLVKFNRIIEESTKWYLFFGNPLLFIFLIFPKSILYFMYPEYVDFYWLFYILAPSFYLLVVASPFSLALLSMGKTKEFNIISIITIFPNLILNFILIPYFGLIGAAIATFITMFLSNGLFIYYAHKLFNSKFSNNCYKSFLSSLVMVVFLILIQNVIDLKVIALNFRSLFFGIELKYIELLLVSVLILVSFLIYLLSWIIQNPFSKLEIKFVKLHCKKFNINLPFI